MRVRPIFHRRLIDRRAVSDSRCSRKNRSPVALFLLCADAHTHANGTSERTIDTARPRAHLDERLAPSVLALLKMNADVAINMTPGAM